MAEVSFYVAAIQYIHKLLRNAYSWFFADLEETAEECCFMNTLQSTQWAIRIFLLVETPTSRRPRTAFTSSHFEQVVLTFLSRLEEKIG